MGAERMKILFGKASDRNDLSPPFHFLFKKGSLLKRRRNSFAIEFFANSYFGSLFSQSG